MSVLRVLAVVTVGLVLQMALARYALGGWTFDLVLVAVVYVSLTWGPASGMWAATAGGLVQDSLSGGVIGIGALAKVVTAYATGVAGSRFIVARTPARVLTVAVVTMGHRLLVVALVALVDLRWSDVGWLVMLVETGLNGLAGFAAFQATELWPGAVRQSRERRRSSLSKRRW